MIEKLIISTPYLPMKLISNGTGLISCEFLYSTSFHSENRELFSKMDQLTSDEILNKASSQLKEYFLGKRENFDIPLILNGTEFQQNVWRVLCDIQYGKTLTYKEIAQKAESPNAFRAAGGACRKNSFAVIIPCHRVLSTNGKLTGYAGSNTFMKDYLLNFEKRGASL